MTDQPEIAQVVQLPTKIAIKPEYADRLRSVGMRRQLADNLLIEAMNAVLQTKEGLEIESGQIWRDIEAEYGLNIEADNYQASIDRDGQAFVFVTPRQLPTGTDGSVGVQVDGEEVPAEPLQ